MKNIKHTVCIFSLIWLVSCHVVHYPAKKTWTGRFDTVRFEKNIKPLCKNVVMYQGDTIKRHRIAGHVHYDRVRHTVIGDPVDCTFNCNDTITIHEINIEKKSRPYILFENENIFRLLASIYGSQFPPFRTKTGVYLENKLTGGLLQGLCKIIYDDKRYSISYYYYGRPFLPTVGLTGMIEYYNSNDEYLYHSSFYPYTPFPIEKVIKSKGNKIIEIVYNWETGQKLRKSIYKKYGDKLLLIKWITYPEISSHPCGSETDRFYTGPGYY